MASTRNELRLIYTSVFAWQPYEIRLERQLLLLGYVQDRHSGLLIGERVIGPALVRSPEAAPLQPQPTCLTACFKKNCFYRCFSYIC